MGFLSRGNFLAVDGQYLTNWPKSDIISRSLSTKNIEEVLELKLKSNAKKGKESKDFMYLKIIDGPADWWEYHTILPGDAGEKPVMCFQAESVLQGYKIDVPLTVELLCGFDNDKIFIVSGTVRLMADKLTTAHGIYLPESGTGFLALIRS